MEEGKMSEFGELLSEEARRVSASPEAFEQMIKRRSQRRTRTRNLAVAVALLVAVGGLGGSLLALGGSGSSSNTNRVARGLPLSPTPVASTLFLDPPENELSFAPPGNATPTLTSDEAIKSFQNVNPEFQLPDEATVALGLYSAAVGDGTYRYKDRLAWGYSWQQCARPRAQPSPDTVIPCTLWLFLDANTGEMLEATWQKQEA
jgi:hypothetical protein